MKNPLAKQVSFEGRNVAQMSAIRAPAPAISRWPIAGDFPHYRSAPQTSLTWLRSQRCVGSASSRGCQSMEIVNSGVETGRGKLCIPARRLPVCRSGTLAIRSVARAKLSAIEKPPTIVMTFRFNPSGIRASSIGPLLKPCRETTMCLPSAYRSGVTLPRLRGCPIWTTPM